MADTMEASTRERLLPPDETARPSGKLSLLAGLSATLAALRAQPHYKMPFAFVTIAISVTLLAGLVMVLSGSPFLILRLTELQMGELDWELWMDQPPYALNSTAVQRLLVASNDSRFTQMSPRQLFDATAYAALPCLGQPNKSALFDPDWKYYGTPGASCAPTGGREVTIRDPVCNVTQVIYIGDASCFQRVCQTAGRSARVFAVDTVRERQMGVGTRWPADRVGPLDADCAAVHTRLAGDLALRLGEPFFLQIGLSSSVRVLWLRLQQQARERGIAAPPDTLYLPYRVCQLFDDPGGRDSSTDRPRQVFVEYAGLFSRVAASFPYRASASPPESDAFAAARQLLLSLHAPDYARYLALQVPEPLRSDTYLSADFDRMRKRMLDEWAGSLQLLLGAGLDTSGLRLNGPMMYSMRDKEQLTQGLWLLLGVLGGTLLALCIGVLISLLGAAARRALPEERVLASIGAEGGPTGVLGRVRALAVLVAAAPGYLAGLLCSYGLLRLILRVSPLGQSALTVGGREFAVAAFASALPVLLAPLLAFARPLFSFASSASVFSWRPTAVRIQRAATEHLQPDMLVAGAGAVALGLLVTLALPLLLLTERVALLSLLYTCILLGLFFGLAVLARTAMPFLQLLLLWIGCGWWEAAAVRSLWSKLASGDGDAGGRSGGGAGGGWEEAMLACLIGVLVFIFVALELQYGAMRSAALLPTGGAAVELGVGSNYYLPLPVAVLEEELLKNDALIDSWSWAPYSLRFLQQLAPTHGTSGATLQTPGQLFPTSVDLQAAGPSYLSASDLPDAYEYFAERLYEPRASGAAAMTAASGVLRQAHMSEGDPAVLKGTGPSPPSATDTGPGASDEAGEAVTRVRGEVAAAGPWWLQETCLLSYPAAAPLFAALLPARVISGPTVDALPMRALRLRPRAGADAGQLRCFYRRLQVLALQQSPELVEIREAGQALSPTAKLHAAFAEGFDGLLFGACLVCLSSLLAVTTLRVQSHAQSIGVLLSIGLRKALLYRAFLEEVFTRQLAAALLGAAAGTFVAMMVTAQYQALLPSSVAASDSSLLALPAVPWHLLGTIFMACAVLSATAALVPLRSLLGSTVVTLLRRPPTLPVWLGYSASSTRVLHLVPMQALFLSVRPSASQAPRSPSAPS